MSLQGVPPPEFESEDLDGYDGKRTSAARRDKERDRKIGHRRINETGQVSYKKIETNQLMGSIQLGIQASIGGLANSPDRDILMQDFRTVETTPFPKNGSKQTPAHPYADFTFRTYAPVAFRYFRDLFGIQPDDFMMSICSEPMRELSNPGASGSIFYLTQDDEFILKTVSMKEAEFLQKLMPGYYMNLQQNKNTTLPKFFGMFCYQCNQKNIRLIVMNNLLPSSIKMHLKFDLKGSTYKRKASKHEKEKKSPTFKDLDYLELLPEGLLLEPDTYSALCTTMTRDCRVLESFKIMDYSLLVGVHNIDQASKEREEALADESSLPESDQEPKSRGVNNEKSRERLVAHSTAMESIQATSDPVDMVHDTPPGGIPARNHKGERLFLFVGIIDILQSYRLIKKLEHTFKAMIHDGDTVSVHRPGFYAERFLKFMTGTTFKKIPSLDLPEVKGSHRKFRTVVASLIALKHSPSKRTKSVKSKSSSHPGGQQAGGSAAPASGQECSAPPSKEDEISGLAKDSPESTESPSPPPQCVLPAVLRDRPGAGRPGRGAPPPVPPRSPRRPTEGSSSTSRGMASVPPDVVPDSGGPRDPWAGSGEALSISDVRLEQRLTASSTNSLGTPRSPRLRGRTPTPTWTEGTPSYTESTCSADQAFPPTPSHSRDLDCSEIVPDETEMTRL